MRRGRAYPFDPHYRRGDEESKGWRDGPHVLQRPHYTWRPMSSPEGPAGNDPRQSVRAIARRAARRAMKQAPMSQVPMNQGSLDQGQMPAALPGAVALESMGRSGPGGLDPRAWRVGGARAGGRGTRTGSRRGLRARDSAPRARHAHGEGPCFSEGHHVRDRALCGAPRAGGPSVGRQPARIAVASDHGGFELKSQLIPLLREMGERPVDLGPDTAEVSVDYPDFASLVAREVSEGRVHLGIIVDGGRDRLCDGCQQGPPGCSPRIAGNAASARNAREHNHANVLTLGSGHLDLSGARGRAGGLPLHPGGRGAARPAEPQDA